MKKNNTTEKSVLNAQKISDALKEGTEKTLQKLINEAIDNIILEDEDKDGEDASFDEEEIATDDSFEVEDVESDEDTKETDEGDEESTEEASDEDENDEWSDFEDFKTDDNDYDFTGEGVDVGEKLLKIFDMIDDGDRVIVTKDGNELEVSNETTGDSEVVELDSDVTEDDAEIEIDVDDESDDDEIEIDVEDDEDEFEIDVEDDGEADDEEDAEIEIDVEDNDLEESYDHSFVTNDYQKKTAMTTPPCKDTKTKGTYSMDAGAPKDEGRPYGGDGDMKPYGEVDESAARTFSKRKAKVKSTSATKKPGRSVSVDGNYYATVVENIKKENEALKEGIKSLKKSIKEAAVLNVNLGRIVNLLVNETTTREEKRSILSRFNNVNSINEGAALYETIKNELNEGKKTSLKLDNAVVVETKKSLNETTIYQERQNNPSLNLMERMDRLYKK